MEMVIKTDLRSPGKAAEIDPMQVSSGDVTNNNSNLFPS